MAGESYAAGGIRTTVAATRAAADEQLTSHVARLVEEMRGQGTTTVEIKSGYGLTTRDEARSLAVARQFTEETTFLGAHVVPAGTDAASYVALVTGPMLEAAAPYARWIDVFCERGAFDEDQARAVLAAGAARGLRGRLHANQLGPGPGVRLAAELPGVLLGLVTCEPVDRVPQELRERLDAHWRVDDALDPRQLVWAVNGLQGQLGRVERLIGALEQLQVPMAQVREALGIEGMDVRTATNVRDKSQMKETGSMPCHMKWDGSQFRPNASRWPIASRVRTVVQ